MKEKIKKIIYIVLGFVFLLLGLLGIVIPILPTTPFLLLSSYFFARGSKFMHEWFTSTRIYLNYVADFIETRSMTLKEKLSILIPVSTLLFFTFLLINNLYARIVIVLLVITKYYYFFNHIKTVEKKNRLKIAYNKDKL